MLNDLVLDKNNGFIYITDSSIYGNPNEALQGAIIIVNINQEPY